MSISLFLPFSKVGTNAGTMLGCSMIYDVSVCFFGGNGKCCEPRLGHIPTQACYKGWALFSQGFLLRRYNDGCDVTHWAATLLMGDEGWVGLTTFLRPRCVCQLYTSLATLGEDLFFINFPVSLGGFEPTVDSRDLYLRPFDASRAKEQN